MHHKYMVIDGDELWSGSYNLSDNAEHNTMENVTVLRGSDFKNVIAAYEQTFDGMWVTGEREGLYNSLWDKVANDIQFPIVFEPMALRWDDVTNLKTHIRDNCADINSDSFRFNPEDHWFCAR